MITIYDVLRRPLVTEKSNYQTGKLRQYSFEVAPMPPEHWLKMPLKHCST